MSDVCVCVCDIFSREQIQFVYKTVFARSAKCFEYNAEIVCQ